MTLPVAIVGSGPAGLMAAHVVASAGLKVHLFEKRPSLGRKILIAGSSGLNISCKKTVPELIENYTGDSARWKEIFSLFGISDWLQFIEQLGLETFLGTSGRYFIKTMASGKGEGSVPNRGADLLRAWSGVIANKGVSFFTDHECVGFEKQSDCIELQFALSEAPGAKVVSEKFSAVCFALGGGSWEKTPVTWPKMFEAKSIAFQAFEAANAGFEVNWSKGFLAEAEGLPLKDIVFVSQKGVRPGELMVTSYGLEGTPIYALGQPGQVWLDLKPAFSKEKILEKLKAGKENLSPIRRVRKFLNLCPAALALLYHETQKAELENLEALIARIKKFPIQLERSRPLEEAISSSGGIKWDEVDSWLMLKKFPNIFVAGEMLDWSAPTGGFLIQACASQGFVAGKGIVNALQMD